MIMTAILSFGLLSCSDDDDGFLYKINNNGHEYVDLGLSVYWATCNIGANSLEDLGNKYAFGESYTKSEYTISNYVGGNEDIVNLNWGGDWRLPTKKELDEIVEACTWEISRVNGYQVVKATGPNGNSIVFPYLYSIVHNGVHEGYQGWYWSSTATSSSKAYCLHFESNEVSAGTTNKYNGFLVRGVISNPNYSSSGDNSGGGSSGDSGSSTEPLHFTYFDFTATQTSVTVKFYTNERATNAIIKYGEYSASIPVTASITNKEISATIKGLKKGTKYYVECTASNRNGSVTSDVYPVITNY